MNDFPCPIGMGYEEIFFGQALQSGLIHKNNLRSHKPSPVCLLILYADVFGFKNLSF